MVDVQRLSKAIKIVSRVGKMPKRGKSKNIIMRKKYIVYLTVNTVNRKTYVGVHKTDPTTFDGYIGCDIWSWSHSKLKHPKTPFHRAVAKYGYSKFERITLGIFDTAEEAYFQEACIVTQDFVNRKDTYNVALGGQTGHAYSKKVVQYTLDGKFLKVWDSITAAIDYYNKKTSSLITKVCNGKYKAAYGYQWRWYKDDFLKVLAPVEQGKAQRIVQYSLEGDFIKIWKSANAAAKSLGTKGEVLKRKTQTRTPYAGYQWRKYTTDPPETIEKWIDPRKIVQLTEDLKVVKEWKNITEASNAGFNNLSKALNYGRKVKGYKWMLTKDYYNLDCDIVLNN